MTKEELIKHWEFIEGFKNGKELEFFDRNINLWRNIDSPSFDIDYEYRFKQEPKYIPFDFSDAAKLIGRSIKSKCGIELGLITYVDEHGIAKSNTYFKFKRLLEDYTFLDGSICGKL